MPFWQAVPQSYLQKNQSKNAKDIEMQRRANHQENNSHQQEILIQNNYPNAQAQRCWSRQSNNSRQRPSSKQLKNQIQNQRANNEKNIHLQSKQIEPEQLQIQAKGLINSNDIQYIKKPQTAQSLRFKNSQRSQTPLCNIQKPEIQRVTHSSQNQRRSQSRPQSRPQTRSQDKISINNQSNDENIDLKSQKEIQRPKSVMSKSSSKSYVSKRQFDELQKQFQDEMLRNKELKQLIEKILLKDSKKEQK